MPIYLSLLLGLAAWAFAVLACVKKSAGWMFSSFALCGVGLVLPQYELQGVLRARNCGEAEDLIGGILFGELVLAGVTILINAVALYRMKKKGQLVR